MIAAMQRRIKYNNCLIIFDTFACTRVYLRRSSLAHSSSDKGQFDVSYPRDGLVRASGGALVVMIGVRT